MGFEGWIDSIWEQDPEGNEGRCCIWAKHEGGKGRDRIRPFSVCASSPAFPGPPQSKHRACRAAERVETTGLTSGEAGAVFQVGSREDLKQGLQLGVWGDGKGGMLTVE